jgi:hypothetical protein
MSEDQYEFAESDLICRMQVMRETEGGYVEPQVVSGGEDDSLDDHVVVGFSNERERAKEEFRSYCNIVKPRKYAP